MRPLTDTCPKPLLKVRGKPLIVWHLEQLALAGVKDVVINTAWLEEQFVPLLGDGSAWDLSLHYSKEGARYGGALETAGGIATALPLLQANPSTPDDLPFWVLAGDVYMPGFSFANANADAARLAGSGLLAHLYLVPNPAHNPRGDFGISSEGMALNEAPQRYTYSTVGLYHPQLFAQTPSGVKAALAPLLRKAIDHGTVSAALYSGDWTDVGTPERLQSLNT